MNPSATSRPGRGILIGAGASVLYLLAAVALASTVSVTDWPPIGDEYPDWETVVIPALLVFCPATILLGLCGNRIPVWAGLLLSVAVGLLAAGTGSAIGVALSVAVFAGVMEPGVVALAIVGVAVGAIRVLTSAKVSPVG